LLVEVVVQALVVTVALAHPRQLPQLLEQPIVVEAVEAVEAVRTVQRAVLA
jgi:hypothetical protein